jgi:hypothetical protein
MVAELSPLVKGTVPRAPKSVAPVRLSIEMGTGDNYQCVEHFAENGLVRRSIKISIANLSPDDISNCNVRLIAATPPAMIGDLKASYQILFTPNFDLDAEAEICDNHKPC